MSPNAHPIDQLLLAAAIRTLAGTGLYDVGVRLFNGGAVTDVRDIGNAVTATVADRPAGTDARPAKGAATKGTPANRTFAVELSASSQRLAHTCGCPAGTAGLFCAHCVALALAWVERGNRNGIANGEPTDAATMDNVVAMLRLADTETLIGIIVSQAGQHPGMLASLLSNAASMTLQEPGGTQRYTMEAARADIQDTLVAPRAMTLSETSALAEHLLRIASTLHGALGSDMPINDLLDTIEFALKRADSILGSTTGDEMFEAMFVLVDVYRKTLLQPAIAPKERASRLFRLLAKGTMETASAMAGSYVQGLDDAAIAQLTTRLRKLWSTLPPAMMDDEGDFDNENVAQVAAVMRAIAEETDDVDLLVEVLRKDRSSPYAFRFIADAYRRAGRHNEALEWAETGLKQFPTGRGAVIVEFLKSEYHRRGMRERELAMLLLEFGHYPTVSGFDTLRAMAHDLRTWETVRPQALEAAREHVRMVAGTAADDEADGAPGRDATLVVALLLYDRDVEAAWNEAIMSGCDDATWMRLAALRGETHPEDARAVYEAQIDRLAELASAEAYRDIVDTLRLLQPLMLEEMPEFNAYVDGLRETYKRRRTFISMLEGAFPPSHTHDAR